MGFTKDQQRVIDTRDKNILVSAAAGSGKTAVLTERIVKKICEEKADIGHMLIVTFTNAAASEMRDRIGKKLRERLADNPEDSHIRKQITILHTAKITTIDSFCLFLLRNHFEEIGLDPSFAVASTEDVTVLADEAFDEVLEEKFAEADKDFLYLIECYAPKGKTGEIKSLINDLSKDVSAKPFMYEWIDNNIIDVHSDISEMPFMKYVTNYENALISEAIECYKKAAEITASTECVKHYQAACEELSLSEALLSGDFDYRTRKLEAWEKVAFKYGAKKFSPDDLEAKEAAKVLIDRARKNLETIQNEFHTMTFEKLSEDMVESIRLNNAILNLLRAYLRAFDAKKREKNLIDFSDMEHFALEILIKDEDGKKVPTETALSYRRYFDEIMIDEYQDSNEVQEILLSVISRENEEIGNRFMVGDIKQSIYGFRLAKPEIFGGKYEEYAQDTDGNDRIDLSMNFRSRREVIDAVNRIFEKCMIKEVGGVGYTKDARLVLGKDYPEVEQDNNAELLYFNPDENESKLTKRQFEARMIAVRIKELMESDFKVFDKKSEKERPIRYSDIAILLRATVDRDTIYQNELKTMGIPAHVISKTGYFSATEVKLILNLLQAIDNPRQDMPLFAVMYSYMGGFSEEEAARIRIGDQKRRLFDSLSDYSETGADALLREKTAVFLSKLSELRKEAMYVSASDMIEKIYEKFDYPAMVLSLPNGEQRLANIRLLSDTAAEYEAQGIFGIHDFVKHIEKITKKEVDMGEANILDENSNVVKIMTIHKSKGLEFPVCFVSDLAGKFKNISGKVFTDDEFGIGGEVFNLEKRTRYDSLVKNAIKIKKKTSERGELIRVLYVAATRAREKLILTGAFDEKIEADDSVRTMLEITEAQNFMNLIYPTVASSSDVFNIRKFTDAEVEIDAQIGETDREFRKKVLLSVGADGGFEPFVYGHDSFDNLFTKTTVSELKKAAYLEREDGENTLYHDDEKRVPKFVKEKTEGIGGAERGTAYHRVMELMDFAGIYDGDMVSNLRSHRNRMVEKLYIEKEADALVYEKKILDFLETDVSHRMSEAAKAKKLYLEQPFVLSVEANKVRSEFPEDEKVLVQGVIDVYFEEDGELVLLDYKTDKVAVGQELIDRYKTQLDYYKEALSSLEKKPVKEVLIYSFCLGEIISV